MMGIGGKGGSVNVAARLTAVSAAMPDGTAVVEPLGYGPQGKRQYRSVTFRQLDDDSRVLAAGMSRLGIVAGTRMALLLRPGIDFVSTVLALLKTGAVSILIDPGMGPRNMVRCLTEAEPEGFVAIPVAHAVRTLLRRRFPKSRFHITAGRRWFWGGPTLQSFRAARPDVGWEQPATGADDPAAIIFTTGSTGPPKGVLFTHGNFDAQVEELRDFYAVQPGEIDLPAFPLFGLFNCVMGVTAVIPDMNPSRPARVDPKRILEAASDWKVTQTFGSPAVWNRVGRYCQEHRVRLPTVRRVLSAGAPVPAEVLERMKACIHPEGEIHTPYGATEALPVASISASEVLGETALRTREGAGVCVGRRFSRIEWKIVRIVDGPIPTLAEAEPLPAGDIGELIVRGPVVTGRYVTRIEANARSKIADGEGFWHRMGDAGYLDDRDRFWFCGRVAHRVLTADGPMYTIRCEAIFNQHPSVYRSALVGVGPVGQQRPVILVEPAAGHFPRTGERDALLDDLRRLGQSSQLTNGIRDFLLHRSFPVDIRHNAKIFREKLAVWAARRIVVEDTQAGPGLREP
jgi:olefin beta-lactone synthetase